MPLDIAAVQASLADSRLDGWLLYDFRGLNGIAARLAGLEGVHATRRWFYFIPREGAPTKIVHGIEAGMLDALPGHTRVYAERRALEAALAATLDGAGTIAMEYSAECAIPYVSRVDAGTVDLIRRLGPRVVSSGDLVGAFEAAWDEAAIASHRRASEKLHRVKDRAFEEAASRLAAVGSVDEFELQQTMVEWFRLEGLVTDAPPIVAAQEHAGNPHYAPSRGRSRACRPGELLLLDLWGKLDEPGAVYADITWVGYAGTPPPDVARAFEAVTAGRDAAVALVEGRVAAGEAVRGFEVDRAARGVIAAAGFGDQFGHRTGHSLGEEVHGNGVNMDDFETHDDRRLLPGSVFTIEPGIYTERFGIRSEINMVVGRRSAEVTGPRQQAFVRIG
jgi:Xaa-Pro aminopeptidase